MNLSRISDTTESTVPQIKGKKEQSGSSQLGLFGKIFSKIAAQSKAIVKPAPVVTPTATDHKEIAESADATAMTTVKSNEETPTTKSKPEVTTSASGKDEVKSDDLTIAQEVPADPNAVVKTEAASKLTGNPAGVSSVDPGKVYEAATAVPGNTKVVNPTIIHTNLIAQTANPAVPQAVISIGQTPATQTPEFGQIASQGNGKPDSIQQNNPTQVMPESVVKSAPTPFETVAQNQLGQSKHGAPVLSVDSKLSNPMTQHPDATRAQSGFPESMTSSLKEEMAPDAHSTKTASNPIVASKPVESDTPRPLQNNQSGKILAANPDQETVVKNSEKITDSKTTPAQVRNVSPDATTVRQSATPEETPVARSTPKETSKPNNATVTPAPNQKHAGEPTITPNIGKGDATTNTKTAVQSSVGNGVRIEAEQNIPRAGTTGAKPMAETDSVPVNTHRPANPIDDNSSTLTPRTKAGVALPDVAAPAQKIAASNELNPAAAKNPVIEQLQEESPAESAKKSANPDSATLTRVSTMMGKAATEPGESDRKKTGKDQDSKSADLATTRSGKSINVNIPTRSTVRSEFDRIQDFIEGKKFGLNLSGSALPKQPQAVSDANPVVNEKSRGDANATVSTSQANIHATSPTTTTASTASENEIGLMANRIDGTKNQAAALSAAPKDVSALPETIHRILTLLESRIKQLPGMQQMQVKTASYGTLNIQLARDTQTRKVTILVESESAKDAVRNSLPAIHANLDRKGVTVNSIDVRLPWEQPAEKQSATSHEQNFQKNFGSQTESNDGRGTRTPRESGSHANSPNQVIPQPKPASRDFGYNTMEIVA